MFGSSSSTAQQPTTTAGGIFGNQASTGFGSPSLSTGFGNTNILGGTTGVNITGSGGLFGSTNTQQPNQFGLGLNTSGKKLNV